MSSGSVVYEIEKKIEILCTGLLTPVKYYNTINQRNSPAKTETWCTASFYAYDAENICYGGPGVIESGNCTVSLFSQAGKGWELLRMIADEMIAAFRLEPLNGAGTSIVIVRVSAPNEASEGDATQWYSLNFDLEYQLFIS